MSTEISRVDGELENIGARWSVNLNVNGLIGGFGTYNDGNNVQAGWDVDTFWVGRTNENKRKPFIIDGDEVFLDQAVINSLTFSKLRDASGNFVVDSNGRIKATYMQVASLSVLSATLGTFQSAPSGARVVISDTLIRAYDSNNVERVRLGIW